jgi:hypothetical protein
MDVKIQRIRIRIEAKSWIRIRIYSIPDPASKNLIILTQKMVSKLSEIRIRVVHPGTGSRILIEANADSIHCPKQSFLRVGMSVKKVTLKSTVYRIQ